MEGRRIIADQCSAGVKPTTFISQVLNKNCPLSSNLHSSIVKKSYCYRKNGKACINCIFKALFGVVISKFNLPGVQPKMAANILNVFSSTFFQTDSHVCTQMALLGFFLPPFVVASIRTHVRDFHLLEGPLKRYSTD